MVHPSRPILAATVAAWLLLEDALAHAAPPESTPLDLSEGAQRSQAPAQAGGGTSAVVRTVVGLLVVVGLIYGLYWVLGKVKASREAQASGAGLHSLATLPLGPNRTLHLVRVGREVIVVGVGDQGVTPVRAYTEQAALQAGLVDPDDDGPIVPAGAPPPVAPASAREALQALRDRTVRR